MKAETISIIVSVVLVGAAMATLIVTGFKQVRQDMDRCFTELRGEMRHIRRDLGEVRRDVNSLRETIIDYTGRPFTL